MNKKSLHLLAALAILVCAVAVSPASANNLLVNGGFESPIVNSNSLCGAYGPSQCFHTTPGLNDIAGWTVIGKSDINPDGSPNGAPAPVMLMTNSYQETVGGVPGGTPLFFHVESGNQAVDLTGDGNQNTAPGVDDGIKQSVATVKGQTYDLSFWLGHQDGTAPGYTTGPASLDLYLNGVFIQTFTNANNTSDDVNWALMNFDFVATGNQTTLAFINSTSIGNNYAGLDNVSLSGVPEPASLLLVGAGVCGFFVRRLRKS